MIKMNKKKNRIIAVLTIYFIYIIDSWFNVFLYLSGTIREQIIFLIFEIGCISFIVLILLKKEALKNAKNE